MPWVPSSSLMTTGGPFTILIISLGLARRIGKSGNRQAEAASRDKSCNEHNLSRERPMPTDSFNGQTPIISNWRSTARP